MVKAYAIAAIVLGVLISVLNWYTLYSSHRRQQHVSPVPLLGGLLLVFGLLSFGEMRCFAWIGLLADYGTLVFLFALPVLLRELWQTSRFNLVHWFVSDQAGRHDDIRLFRSGRFIIRSNYNPPAPCNQAGALIQSVGLVGRWQTTSDGFRLEGYSGDRVLEIQLSNGLYVTEEKNYPADREPPYDKFDARLLTKLK